MLHTRQGLLIYLGLRYLGSRLIISWLLTDEIKNFLFRRGTAAQGASGNCEGSNDPSLREAFQSHFADTLKQVKRLEPIAALLAIKPTGTRCVGMEGVIGEGAEALEEDGNEAVLDLGLFGAGSRVEHYEMAGYLTVISLAQHIGATDIVILLKETLAEKSAELKLRKLAGVLLKSPPAGN